MSCCTHSCSPPLLPHRAPLALRTDRRPPAAPALCPRGRARSAAQVPPRSKTPCTAATMLWQVLTMTSPTTTKRLGHRRASSKPSLQKRRSVVAAAAGRRTGAPACRRFPRRKRQHTLPRELAAAAAAAQQQGSSPTAGSMSRQAVRRTPRRQEGGRATRARGGRPRCVTCLQDRNSVGSEATSLPRVHMLATSARAGRHLVRYLDLPP